MGWSNHAAQVFFLAFMYWLSGSFLLLRTILMTTSAPVSRATLEETVRWRLMSVCLVLVRMEEHVLTLLMGTTATAAVNFRWVLECLDNAIAIIILMRPNKYYTLSTWHFQGENCETDLNRCRSNPCTNGGTCVNLPDDFRCSCAPGFTGSDCSVEVDWCELSPCLHGNCSVSTYNHCHIYTAVTVTTYQCEQLPWHNTCSAHRTVYLQSWCFLLEFA